MVELRTICQFVAGFFVGILLGVALQRLTYRHRLISNIASLSVVPLPRVIYEETNEDFGLAIINTGVDNSPFPKSRDNDEFAKELKRLVNITCLTLLLGSADMVVNYVNDIMDTWGKRCTNMVFFRRQLPNLQEAYLTARLKYMNSDIDVLAVNTKNLNATGINNEFTRFNMAALKHVIKKYPDTQWVIRTTLSTYIIVENLRYFLYDKSYQSPVIYGEFSGGPESPQTNKTISLNAGVVFSREALKRIVNGVDDYICNEELSFTKLIPQCMGLTQGEVVQPFDDDNTTLFNSFHPMAYMLPENKTVDELTRLNRGNSTEGRNLPSRYPISFCSSNSVFLKEVEMLVYQLATRGVYDTHTDM